MSLLGGVGLFLYGMTLMASGIRHACGHRLQKILERATKSPMRALLVGTGLTVLVQSSSATGAMVISFVSSGFMTLVQAAGVTLGANIGTTITAQVTAFNLTAYAPLMVFAGALLALFVKEGLAKHIGAFILGFGMLFQGIGFMKSAIAPLATLPAFTRTVQELSDPFLLILIGTVFTALLQSSSSSTVIIQAFAVEGLIDFPAAVYLLLGAAIGAVAPNFLSALTTNRDGKRTAMINLVFNLFRTVLVLAVIKLIPATLSGIQALSPGDVARQVANAHTLFALVSALVALPFTGLLVRAVQKIMPLQEDELRQRDAFRLHYMNNIKGMPGSIALKQAKKELSRMGHIALDNLEMAVACFFEPSPEKVKFVAENEEVMDWLDRAIIAELSKIKSAELSKQDMDTVYHMTLTVSDMERLSDYAENLAEHAVRMQQEKTVISEIGRAELKDMSDLTLQSVRLCMEIFDSEDYDRLPEAEALEQAVDNKQEEIVNSHVKRLMKKTCDPLGGVIFTDFTTEMERCSDHGLNIAYSLSRKQEKKDKSSILSSVQ